MLVSVIGFLDLRRLSKCIFQVTLGVRIKEVI